MRFSFDYFFVLTPVIHGFHDIRYLDSYDLVKIILKFHYDFIKKIQSITYCR